MSPPADERRAEAPHAPSAEGLNRPGNTIDRVFGLGWMTLGLAIVVESWRMDRLEQQHINPWTVPGLVPGLLGLVLMAFGLVLTLRRHGHTAEDEPLDRGRAGMAIILCFLFAGGLVGSGLPFWAAAFLFVFVAILAFDWEDRRAAGTLGKGALQAALIAAGNAVAVTIVFQEIFLVRLP